MIIKLAGRSRPNGFIVIDEWRKFYVGCGGEWASSWDAIVASERKSSLVNIYYLAILGISSGVSIYALLVLFANLYIALPLSILAMFILSMFILSEMGAVIMCLVWLPLRHKRYHGLEHKVINMLEGQNPFESGVDISLENLRRASRTHPRCGTRTCSPANRHSSWYNSFFQRFIATAEPDEEQLLEGLKVANEYYEKALEFDSSRAV